MFPLPLLILTLFAPDSAWWLVRKDRVQEAKAVIGRLYTHDPSLPYSKEDHCHSTVAFMAHTIQTEIDLNTGSSFAACFQGTNLRRTEIACVSWGCQLLPGFVIQSYITYFFTLAGIPATQSFKLSLGMYGIASIGTFLSWFLQARFGRRTIYMAGLTIMAPLMLLVGLSAIIQNQSTWVIPLILLMWFLVYGSTTGPVPYAIAAEA